MARSITKLTSLAQSQIVAFIRAGAFPNMAAEAAGVPAEIFNEWMARGCPLNRPPNWKPHKRYTPLWQQVRQAVGQARVSAEVDARNKDPLRWLLQGPGKEQPDVPGWSQTVRPQLVRSEDNTYPPELLRLLGEVREALLPHPDALAAVNRAMASHGLMPGDPSGKPAPPA